MEEATSSDDSISKLLTSSLHSRKPEGSPRPFPVLVAGKQLHLSQLLNSVSLLGGYASVTASAHWTLIATQLGLQPTFAPTLKLIYLKYLKCLERSTANPLPSSAQAPSERKSKRPRTSDSSSGKHCLEWLRSLALDPGSAPSSTQRDKFLPKIRSLRRNPEPPEARPRRATKYSLRQFSAAAAAAPEAPTLPAKDVPIGEVYQAEVPEFRPPGEPDEDSKRFLGTITWPRRDEEQEDDDKLLSRSRARCTCNDKGSIECVRLHVDTEQKRLKLLLGELFTDWGFDRMGERVAKGWDADEQHKFRRVFIRSPAVKDVWSELKLAFPTRRRRDLVSFFFNVYMLRKRALQNRLGKSPDSDDDEEDPGYAPVATPAPGGASVGFHAVHLVELD